MKLIRLPNPSDVDKTEIFGIVVRDPFIPTAPLEVKDIQVLQNGRIVVRFHGSVPKDVARTGRWGDTPVKLCLETNGNYIVGEVSADQETGKFALIKNARFIALPDASPVIHENHTIELELTNHEYFAVEVIVGNFESDGSIDRFCYGKAVFSEELPE